MTLPFSIIKELKCYIRGRAREKAGSDIVASGYHERSRNNDNSFVHENCRAFPRNVSWGRNCARYANANNGRKFHWLQIRLSVVKPTSTNIKHLVYRGFFSSAEEKRSFIERSALIILFHVCGRKIKKYCSPRAPTYNVHYLFIKSKPFAI